MAAAMALGIVTGHAAPAQAQDSSDAFPNLLLFGVHYGAPERLSGSISGVFPYGRPKPEAGNVRTQALEIRGRIGPGGYGVGVGPRWLLYGPFGPEAMLTVSRTFSSPRHAIGQSTYVGLEVGYQLFRTREHWCRAAGRRAVGSTRHDADLERRRANPIQHVAMVNGPRMVPAECLTRRSQSRLRLDRARSTVPG